MRLLVAFFKMIRLPNLIFIALTQILFHYAIYYPLFKEEVAITSTLEFFSLVLASVLIAAAGYIINDYFDINIDEVNKPDKMVVNKVINRRWALLWHLVLSGLGLLFTALAINVMQQWYLIVANIGCVALLWFYSTTFKRKLLIGNILISLLTSWTILVVFFSKFSFADAFTYDGDNQVKLFRFAVLYAAFAFLCTIIREAVKDVEDMHGDAKYGCTTMPIVWGVTVSKVYTAVWLVILTGLLLVVQVYVLQFGWWLPVIYCIVFILVPLAVFFQRLHKAADTKDFSRLSNNIKLVMLTGILSMALFYFYL